MSGGWRRSEPRPREAEQALRRAGRNRPGKACRAVIFILRSQIPMASYTISSKDGASFSCAADTYILAAAEKQGIDLP